MNLIQDFLRARRRRLAIRDLRGLSSEQLRDIGVEPGGIDTAVSKMLGDQAAAKQPENRNATQLKSSVLARSPWPYPGRHSAA